ncbi:hypothetical protein [Blastococcus litoris]|uniref:hypothetical protein n=1 Tax=Blastococcus litoris TaxID=2171622 RepID=UPI0013DEE54A|nr:hypothetical protein [Blastococcus litoris]
MSRVEVQVRYLSHDVWVLPELLGSAFSLRRDDADIRIALPESSTDFQPSPGATEVQPTPACFQARTFNDPTGPDFAVAVRLFSVSVTYDADVPDRQPADAPDSFFAHMEELAAPGLVIAQRAGHDFLRWLRVSCRQGWLGLSEEPPAQYGRAGILNADTGQPLMGLGPQMEVEWRSAKLALTRDDWLAVTRGVTAQEDPPVAESLLADARHMLQGSDVPDAQRAVLVSAMACEIKAKIVVRSLASLEQQDLLALVMSRMSSAPDLVDRPLAALGLATLKSADAELGSALRRLTDLRNRVVHTGVPVAPEEAREGLLTAERLLEWLNNLSSTASSQ